MILAMLDDVDKIPHQVAKIVGLNHLFSILAQDGHPGPWASPFTAARAAYTHTEEKHILLKIGNRSHQPLRFFSSQWVSQG